MKNIVFQIQSGKKSFSISDTLECSVAPFVIDFLRSQGASEIFEETPGVHWLITINGNKLEYWSDDLMGDALYASDPSANELVEKIGLDLEERLKAEMSKPKEI